MPFSLKLVLPQNQNASQMLYLNYVKSQQHSHDFPYKESTLFVRIIKEKLLLSHNLIKLNIELLNCLNSLHSQDGFPKRVFLSSILLIINN